MLKEKHSWWLDLRHGGMLISPAVLEEVFPMDYETPNEFAIKYLRERYSKFAVWFQSEKRNDTQLKPVHDWVEYVLEKFLHMTGGKWLKGSQINDDYAVTTLFKDRIKPNKLYFKNENDTAPLFAIFIDGNQKLGTGKSRKSYGRLLQYLRAKNIKMGILTNGSQFRLCYAGLDHESWIEWDTSDWFESAEFLPRLYGFFTLLGSTGIETRSGFDTPLLYAIESSRTRQGELSSVLGEQVRQAIELLVEEFNHTREKDESFTEFVKTAPDGSVLNDEVILGAVFQSSVRIIMRIVVVLFAEARDLLPRSNERYDKHYGIEGLFESLRHARSAESNDFMDDSHSEWLRLLGLFRLIYSGSPHPDLQIPRYGGDLFAPGNLKSYDPVSRALALFEDPRLEVSNSVLLSILEKLKFGKLKIKKGRTTAFVKGPVNFGELRTEYIGMIYEGILNYGLRAANETMLLINSGLEPILPLSVLETLTDSQLKEMFDKLSKSDSEETTEDVPENVEGTEDEQLLVEDEELTEEIEEETGEGEAVERAQRWAEKAVIAIGWVKKPKRKVDEYAYQNSVRVKAKSLVKKIYSPGDFYLSLWGGTRKGTGTFYTKPQLAVPTVRRTLEPLVYTKDESGILLPKLPEEILSVKICDTSCGSASFLVAATQYMTDAMYNSLLYHANLADASDYKRKTLPLGLKIDNSSPDSMLPCSPDEDGFEDKVKVRLRRSVVEHCIYGVDLNPMAVELARLSLWIETMDKDLPFEFLDHKIKVGNSLVGTRLDTFQEYPLAAWLREGGDKSHPSSTHHKEGSWTRAIKDKFQKSVKPEMISLIRQRHGELTFSFSGESIAPIQTHDELFDAYVSLHDQASSFFGLENKEKIFIENILRNPHYLRLKDAMDLWCSLWFWPVDKIDDAPTPLTFYSPSETTIAVSKHVAQHHRFFHWEIEFPDVFCKGRSGFDAVVGNPPWEISKPNSKEFFSRFDPMYRSYGKQKALSRQAEYFEANSDIETTWLHYLADFKSLGNYFGNVFAPFGDHEENDDNKIGLDRGKINDAIHFQWREQRKKQKGFTKSPRPYRYQGSADLNLYKLFLEESYSLLKESGRIGMIVPSGIYSDKGTKHLRQLFLNQSSWEWLFGFENRSKLFDIDSRFKFNPLIVQKGGITDVVKTTFMRQNISDWEKPEEILEYPLESMKKFSPFNLSLLEITNRRDAEIIEKIYSNSVLLGDKGPNGWGLEYSTEFHMTSDSKYFHNRIKLLQNGYKQDAYGRLIGPDGTIMLPLYQGVMIWQNDFSAAGYVSGAGNRSQWRDIGWEYKTVESQFYISTQDYQFTNRTKLVIRAIQNATNQRTLIASVLPDFPCGNSLAVIFKGKLARNLLIIPFLNSFPIDLILRKRMSQNNINSFLIEEMPVPKLNNLVKLRESIIKYSGSLNLVSSIYSLQHLELKNIPTIELKKSWALTPSLRAEKQAVLDAVAAELYNLDYDDFTWLLRDDSTEQKGFWRVDKEKPTEIRQTTLALHAFKRLKEVGLDEFIKEDWQLPEEVQKALGPRFYDWQLEGTSEESWAECEFHAKQILGEEGFKKFLFELENPKSEKAITVKEPEANYGPSTDNDNLQMKLF